MYKIHYSLSITLTVVTVFFCWNIVRTGIRIHVVLHSTVVRAPGQKAHYALYQPYALYHCQNRKFEHMGSLEPEESRKLMDAKLRLQPRQRYQRVVAYALFHLRKPRTSGLRLH